jgi:hypothetical protein
VFADPFARHITKIGETRASRPQPIATLGQIVHGEAEQRELLRIGRKFVAKLEAQYDDLASNEKEKAGTRDEYVRREYKKDSKLDEGHQLRILLASLTTYKEILESLTKDPSTQVRQAAFQNPYAGTNYRLFGTRAEGFFLSNPMDWGPQISAKTLPRADSVGVTINPYGFDPGRHLMLVARDWKQELQNLDSRFFSDALQWAQEYVRRLKNSDGEPEWIDYDKGKIVKPTITWGNLRSELVDGIMLGMNFGMGRLMELDGGTSSIKTTAWASQIQAHLQFSVLLRGFPYPQYDQIHEVCMAHSGFMVALAKAYRESHLRMWDDDNAVLYAARAPRSVGEMGILAKNATCLMEADEKTLNSIANALVHAVQIMQANNQFTFNIISFGKRLSDAKECGVRLLFEIIPRGGLAYSELADQWVVDKFPEDYVKESGERLRERIPGGFGKPTNGEAGPTKALQQIGPA